MWIFSELLSLEILHNLASEKGRQVGFAFLVWWIPLRLTENVWLDVWLDIKVREHLEAFQNLTKPGFDKEDPEHLTHLKLLWDLSFDDDEDRVDSFAPEDQAVS